MVVSNRLFDWLATHPGVGVFLSQTGKRWLVQWPLGKEKRLVCCVAGTSNCLGPLGNTEICCGCVLCFFSVFFPFVLKVCSNLTSISPPLLFYLVFLRCCLCQFCVPLITLTWPTCCSGLGYKYSSLLCVLCCVSYIQFVFYSEIWMLLILFVRWLHFLSVVWNALMCFPFCFSCIFSVTYIILYIGLVL